MLEEFHGKDGVVPLFVNEEHLRNPKIGVFAQEFQPFLFCFEHSGKSLGAIAFHEDLLHIGRNTEGIVDIAPGNRHDVGNFRLPPEVLGELLFQ